MDREDFTWLASRPRVAVVITAWYAAWTLVAVAAFVGVLVLHAVL